VIGDIFQPTHLLFLLVIVLLVLGPKRLPEMARSLGRGFRDFRDAISGEDRSAMNELQQQPIPPTAPPAPEPAAATRASAQRPLAEPEPQPPATPEPEPVASQASKDTVEGAG
jgi:TatA/E family protein of Tat protein translocase